MPNINNDSKQRQQAPTIFIIYLCLPHIKTTQWLRRKTATFSNATFERYEFLNESKSKNYMKKEANLAIKMKTKTTGTKVEKNIPTINK